MAVAIWVFTFVFVTVSLGVCVTFVCISMCTSMVFVIQLPLPDDIRFVIEVEWSLWPASHDCDIMSLWLCLGVFVTFACINMCTLRVFVIQLPLPDDIRFVIVDEEFEYKRVHCDLHLCVRWLRTVNFLCNWCGCRLWICLLCISAFAWAVLTSLLSIIEQWASVLHLVLYLILIGGSATFCVRRRPRCDNYRLVGCMHILMGWSITLTLSIGSPSGIFQRHHLLLQWNHRRPLRHLLVQWNHRRPLRHHIELLWFQVVLPCFQMWFVDKKVVWTQDQHVSPFVFGCYVATDWKYWPFKLFRFLYRISVEVCHHGSLWSTFMLVHCDLHLCVRCCRTTPDEWYYCHLCII